MHPVERKLQFEIVPYFLVADGLRLSKDRRVFTVYTYSGELFVLLGSFGISNPIVQFLSSNQVAAQGTVAEFLGSGWIAVPCLALLALWGLMKFYIQSNGLSEKIVRLNQFIREVTPVRNKIESLIVNSNPMSEIVQEQIKLIDIFDKYREEGIIPAHEPRLQDYREQSKAYTESIVRDHRGVWQAPTVDTGGREPGAAAKKEAEKENI